MSKAKSPDSLKLFSSYQYQILRAAAECIVPDAYTKYNLDVALFIDNTFAALPDKFGKEFGLLLAVFEFLAIFASPFFKRFTAMSFQNRIKYLKNWEQSGLPFKRMGFQALKRTSLTAYYGSEETWKELRYGGPWLDMGYPRDYKGEKVEFR